MQTIDLINTAKWILGQYSKETRKVLLAGYLRYPDAHEDRASLPGAVVRAALEAAVAAERINGHPFAPAVLAGFGLEVLADRDAIAKLADSVATSPLAERRPDQSIFDPRWVKAWDGWWIFERFVPPVERLTIPPQVSAETDFDDVLTLELRYEEDVYPKAETLAEVLQNANRLYASIARAHGARDFSPLYVVYADSGSSIRIDLKGLGEPIKEAKNLLVELWSRFRHRRAEDYRANSEALLGGLKVITVIDSLRQQGTINDEDAARYRLDILEAGIRLFESGTLPREVPRVEMVPNQAILTEIHRKLLPAPTESPAPAPEKATRPKRKSTKRKPRR